MRKVVLAVRHVHFEDCGILGDVLEERGYTIHYVDAGLRTLSQLDSDAADLLVGLGGPVSVYDHASYPWIEDELQLYARWIASHKPLIGICLGAQMLAAALGARVYPGPVKELGWTPLTLTAAGKSSVIASLENAPSMLHWHGDTFDLPAEATLLASTSAVRNQIYEWGGRALAFQCHPEVLGDRIESWLIGHAVEIAAVKGVTLARLREDTARFAPALAQQARLMFGRWLDRMRL